MKPLLATLAALICVAALDDAVWAAKTGYLQEGRYYASPAGVVAWMEVTDALLLVSDKTRAVAAISRADGVVRWSHHPSGGRIDDVALSAPGDSLVVTGVDLEVVDTRTGAMRWAMRLGCRRPCEHRVHEVTDDAVFVTGSGVTHQWLWRYRLSDGAEVWAKPLAIAHPRGLAFGGGGRGWLLEANAPFAVRRLELNPPAIAARSEWRSGGRTMAPQRLAPLRDGRAVLLGPLPGGGMPAVALWAGVDRQPPRTVPLVSAKMRGARVSRVVSHNRLLTAVARAPAGTQLISVWDIDRPTAPIFEGAAQRQVATLGTSSAPRAGRLIILRRDTAHLTLDGFDDSTGATIFQRRLRGPGGARMFDAGGAIALVVADSARGALALIDPHDGALLSVGAIDRASTVRVVRKTATGLYVGSGRGVLSLLRVPLARALAELRQAAPEGAGDDQAALKRALRWAPSASAAVAELHRGTARAKARKLSGTSGDKRVQGVELLLRSARSADVTDAVATVEPLLPVIAEAGLGRAPAGDPARWAALSSAVDDLITTHGGHVVSPSGRSREPPLRRLVVLTSAALIQMGQANEATTLLGKWLSMPVTKEPGLEALRGVAAVRALDTLFASQMGPLAGADDAARHAAARALASFGGGVFALGAADWLQERARPVLTPSRPESLRAAKALIKELAVELSRRTLRGRLGLGGPGCALTCRALRESCDGACPQSPCVTRYKRCLKTCKRRRVVTVKPRRDTCR